ncbi:MAG: glycine betaine/L-proline ABC transporter ATP-binding protein [Desulfobacterales bacterium]|jgi:glycine betaine/proline transport system ATP-binding protein
MTAINAQHVYKIFGENPQKALALLLEGRSKKAVQEETGQVIGVQDVSFQLESGSLFVIMGLSGSGKSTLLRCINRLIEPTKGEIYIENGSTKIEIGSLGKKALRKVREKQIAMIFQHFALFPNRNVLSNVTFGLEIQGIDKNKRLRKGKEVLELVGLQDWPNAYPSQLSGGMQQRVGLARALANEAEILLMDEPFSALDPLIKVNMQDELLKLREKVRRTILFVTHDLDEALKIGDRIAIMEDGQIVQSGTPEEIIVNPRTEYVANFVEHADPSGVLTAGTIARRLPVRPAGPVDLDTKVSGIEPSLSAEEDGIIYCINEGARPFACIRKGKTFSVRKLGEDLGAVDRREVFIAAGEDTPLKEIMGARLKISDNPIIILNQAGEFKGIVGVHEILQGILEKGRGQVQTEKSREE